MTILYLANYGLYIHIHLENELSHLHLRRYYYGWVDLWFGHGHISEARLSRMASENGVQY